MVGTTTAELVSSSSSSVGSALRGIAIESGTVTSSGSPILSTRSSR
jgi:hypothetical protein